MIFNDTIYMVYVDDSFVGIAEQEDYIWDVAQDSVNGTSKPLYDDDMGDRIFYEEININEWKVDNKQSNIIKNRYNDKLSFSCGYKSPFSQEIVDKLNTTNLEKERFEAKKRAMAL